jgi:hypothetical protein
MIDFSISACYNYSITAQCTWTWGLVYSSLENVISREAIAVFLYIIVLTPTVHEDCVFLYM